MMSQERGLFLLQDEGKVPYNSQIPIASPINAKSCGSPCLHQERPSISKELKVGMPQVQILAFTEGSFHRERKGRNIPNISLLSQPGAGAKVVKSNSSQVLVSSSQQYSFSSG